MSLRLYKEPDLGEVEMVASWPGMGNVGVIAVDTLRGQVHAEELGEIEPYDLFFPRKAVIKAGILEELEFPVNKFYYRKLGDKGLILFLAEEQPAAAGRMYAEGAKGYQMANMVLDVAARFGCRRVYTSGAAIASSHHLQRPRVWAATSALGLNKEVRRYENTVLMSEIEGLEEQGNITGLNGLLLGLAKKRGLESICLMGEIPDYLSRAPFPYPRAAKSVLEVLSRLLGIEVDYDPLDRMAERIDEVVETLYDSLPPEVLERIEQRRTSLEGKGSGITDDDASWIREHVDDLFKKGHGSDERSS
ncbi:MAG: PAC2 family protein [Chloroflexota bacterium]|nr:PAC2 family protein [Chloroflexota bacterium]